MVITKREDVTKQGFCKILWRKLRLREGLLLCLIWVCVGGSGVGGRLFEAGHLLTFSAFGMGAYSRWALIRINTVALRGTMQSYLVFYGQQWPAAAQVVHTHRTSCRSGWSKRSGPLNSSPLSWIFTPVSVGSSPRSYLLGWFSNGTGTSFDDGKARGRTKLDFRCPICCSAIGQASCLICERRLQLTFLFCY